MVDWLKTYVINLDKDENRMQQIDHKLRQYKIPYIRFPAVNGKSLTTEQINEVTTFASRHFLLSYAMLGCALSHINLYKAIAESTDDHKWYLILEDDAIFTDDIVNFLDNFRRSPIYEMDDVYISLSMRHSSGKNAFTIDDEFMSLFVTPIVSSNNTAYLITRNIAIKILDYFTKHRIIYHIDVINYIVCLKLCIKYICLKQTLIDFTLADSESNISNTSTISKLFKFLGFNTINFYLSGPLLTFNLKYSVNGYMILYGLLPLAGYLSYRFISQN